MYKSWKDGTSTDRFVLVEKKRISCYPDDFCCLFDENRQKLYEHQFLAVVLEPPYCVECRRRPSELVFSGYSLFELWITAVPMYLHHGYWMECLTSFVYSLDFSVA
jgi:hypothetical protein